MLILVLLAVPAFSQNAPLTPFDFELQMRGLTHEDITIPVSFDEEMSVRSGFRFILPVVKDFMQNPLGTFDFPDSLLKMASLPNEEFLRSMFEIISHSCRQTSLPRITTSLSETLNNFYRDRSRRKSVLGAYTAEEKQIIFTKIGAVLSDAEDIKTDNKDIFAYNRARDSSIAISKRITELLGKCDKMTLYDQCADDFMIFYSLYRKISDGGFSDLNSEPHSSDVPNVEGEILYYSKSRNFTIVIGGKGKNRYSGYFDAIIDLGGDDVYELKPPDFSKGQFPQCIIDMSGNDVYQSKDDFCVASALFGAGFIFDKEGDDVYAGAGTSVGSAICGLAVIVDENGNDFYKGVNHSLGAGTFGIGAIIDNSGNDIYSANSNSQGFGSTGGLGVIRDDKGNDSYIVDSRSLDLGRYEDHYISMCQGYGNGVRPYFAGGIGIIIESEGNDLYSADIFGQGGAYWFSAGFIADKSGNDRYNTYQYGQGAGIHLAVGVLKDFEGWDFYSSNGVSQGCGHDYGFGLLYDVLGNDNYSAYSLSQGAGNANGIGILLDAEGRDGYLNKEPFNTRGYGNSRREYGSIGIFCDGMGEDFYSLSGYDSTYSLGSMWGGFLDFPAMPGSKSQFADQGFKVPVDSARRYSKNDYLLMAKTIEPRFSFWKDYGFRKLLEDSIQTAEFILDYLETEDHRVSLVLRDLAQKIGTSVSQLLSQKLMHYLASASVTPPYSVEQVSFMCYLIGESGCVNGKQQILDLARHENKKIRSSSINALGKMKDTENDSDFKKDAAALLREISSETGITKLLRKDIAYAMKKFSSYSEIPTLMNMLDDDYFASRFLAAECLSSMGSIYYSSALSEYSGFVPKVYPGDIAFLMSLDSADTDFLLNFSENQLTGERTDAYLLNIARIIGEKPEIRSEPDKKARVETILNNIHSITNLRYFRHEY